jgi:hypothetical protein
VRGPTPSELLRSDGCEKPLTLSGATSASHTLLMSDTCARNSQGGKRVSHEHTNVSRPPPPAVSPCLPQTAPLVPPESSCPPPAEPPTGRVGDRRLCVSTSERREVLSRAWSRRIAPAQTAPSRRPPTHLEGIGRRERHQLCQQHPWIPLRVLCRQHTAAARHDEHTRQPTRPTPDCMCWCTADRAPAITSPPPPPSPSTQQRPGTFAALPPRLNPGRRVQLPAQQRPHGDVKTCGSKLIDDLPVLGVYEGSILADL